MLLMIAGGGGDAGYFGPIGEILSSRFTVVTYDRRGNSRSPGSPTDLVMAEQTADALEMIGDSEPAYVFGNSLGAVVGIDLALHHPDRVRVVVAHEPPLISVLPSPSDARQRFVDLHTAYIEGGIQALLAKMMESADDEGGLPGGPELGARLGNNLGYFVGHEMLPTVDYSPDLEKLRVPVVVGIGEPRKDPLQHEIAPALAAVLGVRPVDFPSYHHGYLTAPAAFAARLTEVLAAY